MFITLERVSHVGALDLTHRTDRASLEGPCLSVSIDPEEWGGIARISGQTWTLTCTGARWLDACNLTDEDRIAIMAWVTDAGLVKPTNVWRAWHYDSEADTWGYFTLANREAAWAEVEDEPKGMGTPSETGELVDVVAGWRLTEQGMTALERWSDDLDGEAGAVILYAMLKLAPEMPDLAGIWWDEEYNPLSLSCPRGGILPGRLDMFEIHDEHGALPPIREDVEGMEP
ncbi:hypothetical protein KUV57_12080 [Epibacterium sp. DP7N7-1]|nr:hypothetical protein [Epibacterium sp. DP7N7-1]